MQNLNIKRKGNRPDLAIWHRQVYKYTIYKMAVEKKRQIIWSSLNNWGPSLYSRLKLQWNSITAPIKSSPFLRMPWNILNKKKKTKTYHSGSSELLKKNPLSHMHREKGRDLTQSYDKIPYTDRKIQKATGQHKNATKNVDYTTIADRLRTISWG